MGQDNNEDRSIRDIYGANGFFFQQRKGKLNLRALANVNIDELVRGVDIDILQQHIENLAFSALSEDDLRYLTDPQIIKIFKLSQLTIEYLLYSQDQLVNNLNELSKKYTAKKRYETTLKLINPFLCNFLYRNLSKKRQELAEVEESSSRLRKEVKAKKKNIATLEEMIKETNRTREAEIRNIKSYEENDRVDRTIAPVRSSLVTFYVVSPDGLCIEFREKPSMRIDLLEIEAARAFVSKKDRQHEGEVITVRLMKKGKLLLGDSTLEDCGVMDGDTIVVKLENTSTKEANKPISSSSDAGKEPIMKDFLEFATKQQDSMRIFANDLK